MHNGDHMALTAITRELNADLGNCELTHLPRTEIDTGLAQRQHQRYRSVLASLGCNMESVPTTPGLADSVFIEDTALVLDDVAVLCRPGAASRRREVAGVESVLQDYRPLVSIKPPGTLDGGDLLLVGKVIYAGLSSRSNQEGIDQLRKAVLDYGYNVKPLEVTGCLHLKSAVSLVAPGTLLINPEWIDQSVFGDFEIIRIDPKEPHAANALLVASNLIYPNSFPCTMERLRLHEIDVIAIDVSELQKAEGGVTCCSLVFTSG
jgi:dimethylargininase